MIICRQQWSTKKNIWYNTTEYRHPHYVQQRCDFFSRKGCNFPKLGTTQFFYVWKRILNRNRFTMQNIVPRAQGQNRKSSHKGRCHDSIRFVTIQQTQISSKNSSKSNLVTLYNKWSLFFYSDSAFKQRILLWNYHESLSVLSPKKKFRASVRDEDACLYREYTMWVFVKCSTTTNKLAFK